MSFKLSYLPMAIEDIDRLADYLSQFYAGTTGRVLRELEEKLAQLREFPEMCEEYPDDPFFRKLVVSDYLVFYHVNKEQQIVEVYRVLRASWNLKQHLAEHPQNQ